MVLKNYKVKKHHLIIPTKYRNWKKSKCGLWISEVRNGDKKNGNNCIKCFNGML